MRAAIAFPTLPLWPSPPPIKQRQPELAGYRSGDKLWLSVPGHPNRARPATVIAILPRHHKLVLRAECPKTIVEINPIMHGMLLRRRGGEP